MEPGKYLVLATATVRAGPEPDSEKVGTFNAGAVIDVVQEAVNGAGLSVVQTITPPPGSMRGGWVKNVTSKGKQLLQPMLESGEPMAPAEWTQAAATQHAAAAPAAAAPAAPGGAPGQMLVVVPTPYFGNPQNDPNVLGVLPAGTAVVVLQSWVDGSGRLKINHSMGWSPVAAPDGTQLLRDPAAAAAPAGAFGAQHPAAVFGAPAAADPRASGITFSDDAPPPPAWGATEEGVPPAGAQLPPNSSGGGGGAEPSGPPPGSEPGGPPPEPAGLPPNGDGGAYGGMSMAIVTAPEAMKMMAPEGILKVGWIMKSSGGKKDSDGAELVQIIEQWQQRLFTLGKDLEGVPFVCWYKSIEEYKMQKRSNAKTGSFLTLETCRAEVVTTGDMTQGASLEDDAASTASRASGSEDMRKSQMGMSVLSKQFVIITPERNLKCEVLDSNDTAEEWVDIINSVCFMQTLWFRTRK